MTSFFFNC